MITKIEELAGIKMKRIGAPQPADILKASAQDVRPYLNKVEPDVVEFYRKSAKDLIGEMGAEDALAQALACITGNFH